MRQRPDLQRGQSPLLSWPAHSRLGLRPLAPEFSSTINW